MLLKRKCATKGCRRRTAVVYCPDHFPKAPAPVDRERIVSVCIDVKTYGNLAQAEGIASTLARTSLLATNVQCVTWWTDDDDFDAHDLDLTEPRRLAGHDE